MLMIMMMMMNKAPLFFSSSFVRRRSVTSSASVAAAAGAISGGSNHHSSSTRTICCSSYYVGHSQAAAARKHHLLLRGSGNNNNKKDQTIMTSKLSSTSTSTSPPPFLFRYFSTSSDDSQPETIEISIEEAQVTTAKALQMIGWDIDDATIQAEIMVAAELCGNNQGLVKMYDPKMMQPSPDSGKPYWTSETKSSGVLNANQSPGMLAAVMAADKAIELCNNGGNTISIVCTNNTSTSSGQLAFYVERIARQGLVGICMANSPEFVAASKGGKRVFGTNPLAIGVPRANTYPFTFDMSTSAIALFGVLSSKAKGEPLPDQVAYGRNGDWCTDADEVLESGAIATFGGHKGLGLSLSVELIAGALSGSAVLGMCGPSKKEAKSWGHTFIAINPNDLTDNFDVKSKSIIDTVKASSGSDDDSIVRIPGERSMKTAEERKQLGVMPIPIKIWESIVNTSQNGLPK